MSTVVHYFIPSRRESISHSPWQMVSVVQYLFFTRASFFIREHIEVDAETEVERGQSIPIRLLHHANKGGLVSSTHTPVASTSMIHNASAIEVRSDGSLRQHSSS